MPSASLVVIGASAGGVQALQNVLASFPPDLESAVAIALHRSPATNPDRLPSLLQRQTTIPVTGVRDREPMVERHIYISPPGVHLEISESAFRLTAGPRENGARPAIDALFRTAAQSRGRKVVGVLLSGLLDDGTAGLAAIKAAGGYTIAQDPADALFADMPRNAIENVEIDAVCRAAEMGECISVALEERAIPLRPQSNPGIDRPSSFSCPDCSGVLWERTHDGVLHYRCRTGHAYSPASLYARQGDSLEGALWAAIRALEE
ncbi:MAG: chemotaxis protein CheB, partial [Vulcanimicrobiaceae bacterium]